MVAGQGWCGNYPRSPTEILTGIRMCSHLQAFPGGQESRCPARMRALAARTPACCDGPEDDEAPRSNESEDNLSRPQSLETNQGVDEIGVGAMVDDLPGTSEREGKA